MNIGKLDNHEVCRKNVNLKNTNRTSANLKHRKNLEGQLETHVAQLNTTATQVDITVAQLAITVTRLDITA